MHSLSSVHRAALVILRLIAFADFITLVGCCVQYGIKKRDSDANVSSLAVRDEGRKKLSSAGLSGDLQTNQGFVVLFIQL